MRRWFVVPVVAVLCALGAACAKSTRSTEDGGGPGRDAAVDEPLADAATDARPPRPGVEVVSASGRVQAGTRAMDVSIGHWVEQPAVSAGTRRLEGAAVINP